MDSRVHPAEGYKVDWSSELGRIFRDGLECKCLIEKQESPGLPGLFPCVRTASGGLHAHGTTIPRAFDSEDNFTVGQCKQGVILADSNIGARVKLRSALPDDDRSRRN